MIAPPRVPCGEPWWDGMDPRDPGRDLAGVEMGQAPSSVKAVFGADEEDGSEGSDSKVREGLLFDRAGPRLYAERSLQRSGSRRSPVGLSGLLRSCIRECDTLASQTDRILNILSSLLQKTQRISLRALRQASTSA